jgi:S-adenosylmethionine synthetase
VAKNVVAAGLASRCELQVAYAIGVAHPVSLEIDCFGTERYGLTTAQIEDAVREVYHQPPPPPNPPHHHPPPHKTKTAAYGHFGRDDHDYTRERTDKADALRAAVGVAAATPA